MTNQRYVTMWRKTGDLVLDWDVHVSEDLDEVSKVVKNLENQGVHQFSTYPIGKQISEFSSKY